MKSMLLFATLAVISAVLSGWTAGFVASQLWLILALGFASTFVATVLARLLDAPPVRWRVNRPKVALSVCAGLAGLPILGAVAAVTFLSVIPIMLVLPALFWRGGGHQAGAKPPTPRSTLRASSATGEEWIVDEVPIPSSGHA